MQSPVKALLDANVLYPNHLRNLLLQLAQNDLFEVKWSGQIEEEWLRNMEPRTRARIEAHTLPLIRKGFPDAIVTGFDPNQVIGKTDVKDRHVASAAAAIAPCILVTNNLRDFDFEALKTLGVQVQSPDDFLTELAISKPEVMEAATREAAANLTKSNPTWEDYLTLLATGCGLPKYVDCLRAGPGAAPATAPSKAT
ncbi:hypothetical protein [Bradyrhizobium iriomotense]|uniref:hypothetical protein n=1 Tax=Bradyrhizobium iriomotense TaxID=441950 RepID=UPI001B8A31B0|nr:hypothetical protein [Bradyrhizobium iriomotense]MBR0783301.1 hypothetical protein [Bradyrhizobium iriomotense]